MRLGVLTVGVTTRPQAWRSDAALQVAQEDTMVRTPIDPSPTQSFSHAAGSGEQEVWLPWHLHGRAALKASSADSEGRLAQIEFDDAHGTSPPLHVHHNGDETFYVIDGEITVVCDGRELTAGPGGYVFVPRGQAHSYVVRSERARLLVTYAPAGMERFFLDNGVPVVPREPPPPLTPPDPEEFARSAERYACEIVGPPLEP
jgi:quercetin dioxygenase-like cupin family protein